MIGGGEKTAERVGHYEAMRLDHISYACLNNELADVVQRIGSELGDTFIDGGRHPSFGTRNFTLGLSDGAYIEVVAPLDHPSALKAPFGQAVQRRAESGGGWMSWVVATDNIDEIESRLERKAASGARIRPDGTTIQWRQIGILDIVEQPQSPFFVQWDGPENHHPSFGHQGAEITVEMIEINSKNQHFGPLSDKLSELEKLVRWVDASEDSDLGINAVRFSTPRGTIIID